MHILLISGTVPPAVCGVGDYTRKLYLEFKKEDHFEVELFHKPLWSLKYFWQYFREIRGKKADVYHLQYPTEGYGYSLVPLLLILFLFNKKTVVTIHELSSRNFLAKLYTLTMMFLSKKIILTNEVEKCFARRFLINSNKISIIPIASNIVQSNYSNREFEERKIDLAYFGHIRPIKGIEEFLNAVSTIKNVKEVAIIGQKLEKYSDFFDYIFKKSEELGIKLIVNKKEDEVADFLSNVKIVYLPFPDGISSRRGSLLASINNSCIIVSKRSSNPETNSFFQEHCYLLNNSEEASSLIDQILTTPFALKESSKLRFMFSWDAVVQQHKELYSSLN